ncbi:MAG: GPR endopeptidase, partial [Oscillospiraceae bacterium]
AITPDAVGPLALGKTLVTRHLITQLPEHFGGFRPVSAVAAGVLGTTGMESGEVTAALVAKTAPAAVIVVDALASRSISRLCTTLQIADTGITPGSGVGNHRGTLNRETLGVPVIAIGVPTVVDGGTLALDLLEEAGQGDLDPTSLGGIGGDLFVTPRDIDVRVADAAKVIGYGISLALNPHLTVEDIAGFLE